MNLLGLAVGLVHRDDVRDLCALAEERQDLGGDLWVTQWASGHSSSTVSVTGVRPVRVPAVTQALRDVVGEKRAEDEFPREQRKGLTVADLPPADVDVDPFEQADQA